MSFAAATPSDVPIPFACAAGSGGGCRERRRHYCCCHEPSAKSGKLEETSLIWRTVPAQRTPRLRGLDKREITGAESLSGRVRQDLTLAQWFGICHRVVDESAVHILEGKRWPLPGLPERLPGPLDAGGELGGSEGALEGLVPHVHLRADSGDQESGGTGDRVKRLDEILARRIIRRLGPKEDT